MILAASKSFMAVWQYFVQFNIIFSILEIVCPLVICPFLESLGLFLRLAASKPHLKKVQHNNVSILHILQIIKKNLSTFVYSVYLTSFLEMSCLNTHFSYQHLYEVQCVVKYNIAGIDLVPILTLNSNIILMSICCV